MGKYSPGIATERHYFFSLNGILIAYWGRYPWLRAQKAARLAKQRARQREEARRVSAQGRMPRRPQR
jgi:hypothetical protein